MPKCNVLKSDPLLRICPLKSQALSTIIDELLRTTFFEKARRTNHLIAIPFAERRRNV